MACISHIEVRKAVTGTQASEPYASGFMSLCVHEACWLHEAKQHEHQEQS